MERRQYARVPLMAWARCLTGEGDYRCTARDISLGGMLLETSQRPMPPVGTLLEVTLVGPGGMRLECEVVRVHDQGSIGLRFLNLTVESRGLLQQLMASALSQPTPQVEEAELDPETARAKARQPSEARRTKVTAVIEEHDLRPLVAATRQPEAPQEPRGRTAAGRRTSSRRAETIRDTGGSGSGHRGGESSRGKGSDLVKALRSVTGESDSVSITHSSSASKRPAELCEQEEAATRETAGAARRKTEPDEDE